ncbi:unnamed protein product [Caenorhabditis sp. 36 PRJEB53466]|nr:unnamed protein product [Caenorhabditis sp. 36 PRJEB53466]
MSRRLPSKDDDDIEFCKHDVFLLPTRLLPPDKDLEEDLSDVSMQEDVVDEDDVDEILAFEQHLSTPQSTTEERLSMVDALYRAADTYGYDVDGTNLPDDAMFPTLDEAAFFSTIISCGEPHEMECVALWDYFGGNNFDDLNVHAGDTVFVVAEEFQVRVTDEHNYLRLPFQWSLGRWISDRPVNPYLGLIPSHYLVSKQFYDDHPLLFKWPVWYLGNAEVHEVIGKLYSDRSALCPGLFAIFSPAWLNIDLDEQRCYLLMILLERDKKHDERLGQLIEIEKGNYGILTDSINHIFGEMLPENLLQQKTERMEHIEFISEIETTPFAPAVVPIHRSSMGHFEFMGIRYETLYDLVHHLATTRTALPHKLVYCRSSPLVVGRNVVPPPTANFKKDLRCQPMTIEQWAASHFDQVTRRVEGNEKTLFTTKTIFDPDKKRHMVVADKLNLSPQTRAAMRAYLKKFELPETAQHKNAEKLWERMPQHETSIRIFSPFYTDFGKIDCGGGELGKGAFGTVCKGHVQKSARERMPVAVKRLRLRQNQNKDRDQAFNELEILEMVAHPNVVFYYGFSVHDDNLYLLFELMDTSLDKFVDKSDAILSENERLDLLAQICRGMSFLHTRTPPVVHGDLAARNVLLKKHPVYIKKYIAKITDLGLAKTCREELFTDYDDPHKIPFKWLPPEVLSSRTLSLKTDVWAFGIVCFEVCDKMGEPYGALVAATNLCQFLKDGFRHEKGLNMSDTIYEISMDCMREQPMDRPSFGELVERFLDCIIETDGEDEKNLRAREKVMAEKTRRDRMKMTHDNLLADGL